MILPLHESMKVNIILYYILSIIYDIEQTSLSNVNYYCYVIGDIIFCCILYYL
jgi:hypothetical protein